jgi:hypothetical protein
MGKPSKKSKSGRWINHSAVVIAKNAAADQAAIGTVEFEKHR